MPMIFQGGFRSKAFMVAQVVWLAIIIVSFRINYSYLQHEVEEVALGEARAIFRRDKIFRSWLSELGGIYAATSAATPPNPYMAHIPDRDLVKPDGSPLTLINPAYMMRLVYEYDREAGSPLVRMVSPRPLRPENLADAWETKALAQAEAGAREVYEFVQQQDGPSLRYLRPAYIKEKCLQCHAGQGYRLGDLRGGLTVILPLKKLLLHKQSLQRTLAFWHALVFLFGAGLLLWMQNFVGRRQEERDRARIELVENEEKFRTVADFAFAWEYWLDPEGRFKYLSPSVERITGYPPGRFFADPDFVKTIVEEEDRELLHNHLLEDLQTSEHDLNFRIRNAAGEIRWLRHICRPIYARDGSFLGRRASNYDITEEKITALQMAELLGKYRDAMENVQLLRGFLPICANCKKIRDDQGYWHQVEAYISKHSDTVFSHGICPDCKERLYQELQDEDQK